MTDPNDLPRYYGEKEIGQLIKRATELQHEEPSAPSVSGMTLAELEEVALEAGIDPRYLRKAALEMQTSGIHEGGFWASVVGDDLMLVRETAIPGEMAEVGFERIVEVTQRLSREHGQPSMLGRTLTWRAETPGKTRTVQLTVSVRDGATHVRLEENLHQFVGGLFGGTVTGVGVGLGLGLGVPAAQFLGSAALGFGIPIGLTVLSYMGCREIYRHVTKGRRARMGELFSAVVSEATSCIESESLPEGSGPRTLGPG